MLSALSQQKPLDSLKNALQQAKNDVDRAELLNAVSTEYSQTNPAQMVQYAQQALYLSKKIKHTLAEGNANLNLGNANIILGNYPEALRYFSDAQAVFEATSDSGDKDVKTGLARAYGSIGIVFSEQSNYAKALQYHLKAVRLYESLGDLDRSARIYNNIGIVYKAQGDNFRALDYFTKCLKIQQRIGDKTAGITMTNIGNIYLDQKNEAKALEYYDKAKKHFDQHPDYRGLGELYNNLGLYYKASGNNNKALEQFAYANAAFEKIGDKFGASDTYAFIGEIAFAQKQYEAAIANTKKSLELARTLNIMERIQKSEYTLSKIYEALSQPGEALKHYQLYAAAKDSISNFENIRNSVRAEMDFEFDKKQALQKKEQEKREIVYQEQDKRHRLQIVFVSLFILLAFGIVFLIYSRLQLKKTLTLQKELAEYEQKALHLQMNPHFVFNCLGSISSFIVQNGTDSAIKYLSKFSKLMRLTLEYSKESLIPIDKEIESLQNYLELEQLRFNNVFDFSIKKSSDIEDDMALPPLLLQPFVENAIIHGLIPKKENGQISIDFSVENETLVCTITDNGIGIDKSHALKENLVNVHKSMALDITRKRLEMMEAYTAKTAQVNIVETKNEQNEPAGTKVVLHLPIQYLKA
jgi:tetratricopeptide (TPR) repeat protein